MNYVLAFIVGIVWELILGLNTRLVAQGSNRIWIFITTVVASILWGYLIKVVSLTPEVIPSYAIGCGLGVLVGIRISKRM